VEVSPILVLPGRQCRLPVPVVAPSPAYASAGMAGYDAGQDRAPFGPFRLS
jgi:hypothetical protein